MNSLLPSTNLKSTSSGNAFSAYIPTIIITAIIMFLFLTFVGQFVKVDGSSMEPTHKSGQILFVEKISKTYERFDTVTLYANNRLLIKRIIGMPGDAIQIVDGAVYINDELLDDYVDVVIKDPGIAAKKIVLQNSEYFVMGDNRNNSIDSRSEGIGVVTDSQIWGHVLFKLF